MKKIIIRSAIIFFLTIFTFVVFLSTIGIETDRLNNQIGTLIKKFNKDLEIELKQIKILFDPFTLQINAKTVGSKLKIKDKTIELENIKTQISINSLFNNQFLLKNLDISTKSLDIQNLISFARNFRNTTELYLFEKVIKKGYLISDISLKFDDQGRIKNNYKIKGFLKDTQFSFLKKYKFQDINLIFDIEQNVYKFKDIKFSLNGSPFLSEKLTLQNLDNSFFVEGLIENKNIILGEKITNDFIKPLFGKINFNNLKLKTKNNFSFNINKKFKIDNFKLSSKIRLDELKLENSLKLKKFFPNIKNELNLNDHLINIDYKQKILTISGSGNILFQDVKDAITYNIKKVDKIINFRSKITIDKNPLIIDFLGYKKNVNSKAIIDLKGKHHVSKKLIIDFLSLSEKKNNFLIDKLVLDDEFKIKNFKSVNLDYFDEDMRENKIKIIKQKNIYNLTGSKFNANSLIENLINGDDSNKLNIFNQNIDFNIKINQVFLDKEHIINNLEGKLRFKKNEIYNAELNAFFSKNKKFKFTIQTNKQEKVTTLFLDQAESIVSRYKFIKGYKGGSLDFYSSKKGETNNSNLKIYDFKLKELPILTKLLTLASLQGIADILSGEGITFDEFEMNFQTNNNLMTINEMYAIGPAISILMDGYIEKNKLISLRGSLVPATTINKVIGTLPVLGKILVGSKTGEGVFGVSFKIKGPPKNLETTVNPIKTLTPRFITRTLEKIKKN